MINSSKYIHLQTVVFSMQPNTSSYKEELKQAEDMETEKADLPYKHSLVQIWLPSQDHKNTIREFFGSYVKKNFVKKIAEDHLLDELLSPKELNDAKNFGVLPPQYAVHHILPISYGGRNHISNLCVAEEMIHMALHQLVWDKLNQPFYWDRDNFPVAYMHVPTEKRVLTNADMPLFFSKSEITKFKKKYKTWKRALAAIHKWKTEQKRFSKAKPAKLTQEELQKKYVANRKKLTQCKTSVKNNSDTTLKTVTRKKTKEQNNPLMLPPQPAYYNILERKKKKIEAYKEKTKKEKVEKKKTTGKSTAKTGIKRTNKFQKPNFFAHRRKKENER